MTNQVFGESIRFEGIIKGKLPSFVISQLKIEGTLPEPSDINRFFTGLVFERVDALMWYRPLDGIAISDTKRANFITPDEGTTILPIDLPIRLASRDLKQAWEPPDPPPA